MRHEVNIKLVVEVSSQEHACIIADDLIDTAYLYYPGNVQDGAQSVVSAASKGISAPFSHQYR